MVAEDLEERVRRLEITVAALQARLDGEQAAPVPEPALEAPRDLEAVLGSYWLGRAGILALITGLAWFIALHFGELGAFWRVVLGYGLAAGIAGVGLWFARESPRFGQLVLGGGLAVGYFVTYALHFVARVRVVDGRLAGLALLALAILVIVAVAQRLGSETVAGIALFLGFHTTLVADVDVFALFSITLLAVAAAFFFLKNRWVVVPLTSLLGVYSSHALVSWHVDAPRASEVLVSLALGCVYYLVFTVAVLARPRQLTTRVALGFALVNASAFLALGAGTCLARAPASLWPFLAVATVSFAGSAAVARQRASQGLTEAYAGAATVAAAWCCAAAVRSPWHALGIAVLAAGVAHVRWLGPAAAGLAVLALAGAGMLVLGEHGAWAPSFLAAASLYSAFCARGPEGDVPRALRISASALTAAFAMLGCSALVPAPYGTLAWVLAALGLIAAGLWLRVRPLRVSGLVVVALAAAKLLLLDFAALPTDQRILTFVVSGGILLGVSFAYTRFKDQLQRLL